MKIRRPNDASRHPRAQLPGHRKGDPFIRRVLWGLLGRHICRFSFHNWYALRRLVLAAFGAEIHPSAKIRRTARIDCPWNLTMGELSALGDHATITARAPVRVGSSCTLSQHTKIFTQAHDPLDPDFQIYTAPVTIQDDAWIAADVVVMPGVTIGEGVVVGARSFVDRSLRPWQIAAGEPATERRKRPFMGRQGAETEPVAA
ncbi:MAG: putative colanic acid biosynthesis acetyltransferase [Phycisphaerales bacterium JB059]